MRIELEHDEQFSLTLHEITILTALAAGIHNKYQLVRTCAAITGRPVMSNGTIGPALERLFRFQLIRRLNPPDKRPTPGRPGALYELAPAGQIVLRWETNMLLQLIGEARAHLAGLEARR